MELLLIMRHNLNAAETAIRAEVVRDVGERILAAQLILDFREGIGNVAQLEGKERAATGRIGDPLQYLVALLLDPGDVRADGIDDDLWARAGRKCGAVRKRVAGA